MERKHSSAGWKVIAGRAQRCKPERPESTVMRPGAIQRVRRSIAYTALVGVLTWSTVIFSTNAQNSGSSITAQANQLVREGRLAEAEQLLRKSLAAQPMNLDAQLTLANLLVSTGQRQEAESEFRDALQRHPQSAAAELALGTFYSATGSLSTAEQVLGAGVRNHPESSPMRLQFAMVLAAEHQYKQALSNLSKIAPPSETGLRVRYFRLASSIYSGLDEHAAAARAMTEALRANPSDEQLQWLTALADAQANEWKACAELAAGLYATHPRPETGLLLLRAQLASKGDFQYTAASLRALDMPSEQKLQLLVHSAELFAAAGRHEQAVEELAEALKSSAGPEPTLEYNLAVEEYSAGLYQQLQTTLEHLRQSEDSPEIEDLAGDAHEKLGNSTLAVECHRKAIVLAPEQEQFRLSLGAELLIFQSYEEAFKVFQEAAERFPNSPRVYVGLGMADYFLEKYDDSVAAFLRAEELDDYSGRALNYLAATQIENAAGPVPAAITALCARADAHADDAAAMSWCGALLFQKAYVSDDTSGADTAIRRLRSAVKLSPNDAVSNCALGNALQWRGQLVDARGPLETCVRLRPNSVEDHYRLCHVYLELGLPKLASEQEAQTVRAQAAHDENQSETSRLVRDAFREPQGTKHSP
jgi:tetratricopeptide (TPR) repeat protein